MKKTANPGHRVTQSDHGVCLLSQVYATSIKSIISANITVGDSLKCGDALLGERTC